MSEDMKGAVSDDVEDDYDNMDDDLEGLEDDDMLDGTSLFWKLKIPVSGDDAEITEPSIPGYVVHITKASFGVNVQKGSRTVVLCNNMEDEEYVPVCVLREHQTETVPLDLVFGESANFKIEGNKPSEVWLTGYLQPPFEDVERQFPGLEDDDDLDIEEYGEVSEEVPELSSSVEVSPQKKRRLNDGSGQKQPLPKNEQISIRSHDNDSDATTPTESQPQQQGKKKKNKKKNKNKNQNQNQNQNEQQEEPVKAITNEEKKESSENENGNKVQATESVTKSPQSPSQGSKKKNKKKIKQGPQGIEYKDIREGSGKAAKKNDTLKVYYIGQLAETQEIFDKNIAGDGLKFKLGAGDVIKGWDLGLNGMKIGGKRKLWIPAKLGYGSQKQDSIPPNSKLLFTVELKGIE